MAPKGVEYLELAHQRAAEKKTHVSFPQLKYPSLRDKGSKHPVQWLEGKAMDDGAEGLWRVHHGIYDLTQFLNKHPGGKEWLELSKGTDITEAFETHHLNNVVVKMLEKYYVREAKTARNSPFTFKEDGFYKTLKREVVEELKKLPPTIPKRTDNITDGLLAILLVTSVLSLWFTNYWYSMLAYMAASISLANLAVASHNYIHRRTNWRMYLFNLTLWSYREFRISHALSHHLYTNTLMDLEISGFEPFVLWNPRKKPLFVKLTLLVELMIFPFIFVLTFCRRCKLYFTQKSFFKIHSRWHDGIGLLLPMWMYLVSGASFFDVLIMWLWINCTASFIFCNIGANAAHHHPKIFKDGDQVKDTSVDWGMHELEAVMDRTDVNGNLFKVITLFGDHALHHLFPTLDHAILNYLYPVFLRNCEKFKANFRMTSSIDLFIGQLKAAAKVNPNLLGDTK